MEIRLANTRGFCAGVDRAIEIVKKVIEMHGAPVYVKHEVVHNKTVVEELKNLGAIFVEDIQEIPQGEVVVYSAHGISKAVQLASGERNLDVFDATCPLVSKVHAEVHTYGKMGFDCLLIGHKNHPEVEGTMGQVPEGAIVLVEDINDVDRLKINNNKIAYITQTTLSIDDTSKIIEKLKTKFPHIECSPKEDICYATTNRQNAVKKFASICDAFIIVGSSNSSNSNRLVEVAKNSGCLKSDLIEDSTKLNINDYKHFNSIGVSSGASVPDILVMDVIKKLKSNHEYDLEEKTLEDENVSFRIPSSLR